MHDRGPGQAVADQPGAEAGLLPGSLFFVLEPFGFLGLGDLGCHELEEVPAEAAQLGGPELAAQGDHLGLGPRHGARGPGGRAGRRGPGRRRVAWAGETRPSAIPVATRVQRRSRASARRPWARPAGKSARVTDAQPGAVVAGTGLGARHPRRRRPPGASAPRPSLPSRAISATAASFSAGIMNTGWDVAHRLQRVPCRGDRTQDRVRCDGLQLGDHRDSRLAAAHGCGIRWPGAGVS